LSSSQTQKRQNIQEKQQKKKPRERKELTFKLSLCPPIFGSCLYPSISSVFSLASSSSQIEKKNRKTIEKKEMQRREGTFLQTLTLLFHFWVLLLPSFFALSFQTLSLILKQNRKKEKKKNAKKGGSLFSSSLSTLSHFWLLVLDSCFCPFISSAFFVASFSSQAEKKR
jgi:hypothetical protein